jgi:serine protease Do
VLLRSFGADHGIIVTKVEPDGPASRAGLQQGDVITSIDGKAIQDGDDLVARVAETPVGQTVTVRYVRDKKEQETRLVIGDRSEVFATQLGSPQSEQPGEASPTDVKFGLSIQNITPDLAGRLGISANGGVLVTSVDPDSFSEEVGLQRGDIILEVNHQSVSNVDDVLGIQRNLGSGTDVVFLVQRSRAGETTSLYLAGTLP